MRRAWQAAFGLAMVLTAGMAWAQANPIEEQAETAREALEAPSVIEPNEAPGEAPSSGAPGSGAPPRDPSKGAVTGLPIPRFVSLKGNEGNARRGPGLTHRIDWVFTREGMPLKVTGEYEHWRRVEDVDGAGGWVHYMLLSGVRSVLVVQDMAEAHASPDDASEVVFQNELNVVGKLLECVPLWCRVQVEGEKGWLHKEALWGVGADEIYPQ